jgi:hypothetical protein
MKHELVYVNEYRVHLDYSVEDNLKTFKEEVLDVLNLAHKDFNVSDQMFSGGMDSTFILRSLLELGINPKLHTISFSKDQTDYDSLRVKDQCKRFGVPEPEFFYIDRDEFFNHVDFLTYEKGRAYPTLHCYYVDYFLSRTENKNKSFFCGMSCEYRASNGFVTMNIPPPIIKQANPNRLYGFDSSRTFLSYVNNPIFKDNYLKENPTIDIYGEDLWWIRDLIYSNCYSEIDIIAKHVPDDIHLTTDFYQHKLPTIRNLHPIVFLTKPFVFDVKKYFSERANRNA